MHRRLIISEHLIALDRAEKCHLGEGVEGRPDYSTTLEKAGIIR